MVVSAISGISDVAEVSELYCCSSEELEFSHSVPGISVSVELLSASAELVPLSLSPQALSPREATIKIPINAARFILFSAYFVMNIIKGKEKNEKNEKVRSGAMVKNY